MTMLWYKGWLETRARFMICLFGSVLLCTVFILHTQRQGLPETKAWYYYSTIFYAHQYLVGICVLSAVLLGMGGLLREASIGTAPFTLALPVSRSRLAEVRIALGIVRMISLAVLPWVAICAATLFAGHPFVWSQALYYIVLLVGGELVYFSIAVLISSLVDKEYTAPTAALGVIVFISLLPGFVAPLRPYSVLKLMSGNFALDRTTYLLQQPFPWAAILLCFTAAIAILTAAVWIVRRRQF